MLHYASDFDMNEVKGFVILGDSAGIQTCTLSYIMMQLENDSELEYETKCK